VLSRISVVLAAIAIPFLPPDILAAQFVYWGIGLALAALVLGMAADGRTFRISKSALVSLAFLVLLYLWVLFRTQYNYRPIFGIFLGSAIGLISLTCLAVVFSSQYRVRLFLRIFVCACVILTVSGIATDVLGALSIAVTYARFPTQDPFVAQIYLPFSPTVGTLAVSGVDVVRLVGFGREPGWMALFCSVAWFVNPFRGGLGRVVKGLLLIGVLLPISTAGFTIFVIMAIADWIWIRARWSPDPVLRAVRSIVGLVILGAAFGFALFGPVLGFANKSELNAESLQQRGQATATGISALGHFSLGGPSESTVPNVNLMASVAENGWPILLLGSLVVLGPLFSAASARESFAPTVSIFLTILLAQPILDSAFALALVLAVCQLPRRDNPRGVRPFHTRPRAPSKVVVDNNGGWRGNT
jgi:hypothetical protein